MGWVLEVSVNDKFGKLDLYSKCRGGFGKLVFIEVVYLQRGVNDTYYWLTITSGIYMQTVD